MVLTLIFLKLRGFLSRAMDLERPRFGVLSARSLGMLVVCVADVTDASQLQTTHFKLVPNLWTPVVEVLANS